MNPRDEILDWAEQGRIAPMQLRAALEAGGALPASNDWRRFLDRLLLWLGVVALSAALVFFLAYNWNELGRVVRLALAQGAIVIALAFVWRLGLDGASGKAALLAAALATGALLALIGQTYQTGADTFELFAAWAAAILPWALLARFAALWIVWLALFNLALILYFTTFGFFGALFGPEKLMWLLFALDTAALVAWEAAAGRLAWLRERWAARVLATASGVCVTTLAIYHITGWHGEGAPWTVAWLAWLAAAYFFYRRRLKDLFVLAGGALSVIVVTTIFLGKHLFDFDNAFAFLLIAVMLIGMSAAAGWWLLQIAREEAA